jgi:hypothetical protein
VAGINAEAAIKPMPNNILPKPPPPETIGAKTNVPPSMGNPKESSSKPSGLPDTTRQKIPFSEES